MLLCVSFSRFNVQIFLARFHLLNEMVRKRHSWAKRKIVALHVWVCKINAVILFFRQPHIVAILSNPSASKFSFFSSFGSKKEKYYQKKRNFYNILFSFSSPKYVLCRTEYEGERKEKPNLLKETFFFGNSHD